MKKSNATTRTSISMMLLLTLFFIMMLLEPFSLKVNAAASTTELQGRGTKSNPYLIEDYNDLVYLRKRVNAGDTCEGVFFRQIKNIDLKNKIWIPIGSSGTPFCGVYDGAGHYIENLYVPYARVPNKRSGFFSVLGGTVANLGIESGTIYGDYSGSIAAIAYNQNASILNCYSKADVRGHYAGGIACDFNKNGNVIACCWFDGTLEGTFTGGIVSSGGELKLYHTYTTAGNLASVCNLHSATSSIIPQEDLPSEAFLTMINKSVAFTQYLFGTYRDVDLVSWSLDDTNNIISTDHNIYLSILKFINLYFLPLVLIIIIISYIITFIVTGKARWWEKYQKDIRAITVISGIVSAFVNTAFISKGTSILNAGNIAFILLINSIFLVCLAIVIAHHSIRLRFKKDWLFLTGAIILVSIIAIFQFDVVPKFDAGIYYGSLVQAVELFQLDFMSYIGAFVCWKWIHGLALLIAPLEFLFPGQAFGVYTSNLIIIVITMICMYWLLRQIGPKITPLFGALGSLILVLCPYQLGLFSYLCMDAHTAYFLVWLLCSYKKKNHIMVAFCGYLLAFNKISGLVFYVCFLLCVGIFELAQSQGRNIFFKIVNWWNWKKVILWITPAAIYLASTFIADDLTTLNFYGAYVEATIGLKHLRGLANTFMQSFVYGFRWIFTLSFVIGVILMIAKREKVKEVLTTEGLQILVATMVGCLAVLAVLCLYRGDAECPRYTALFNIFYAVSFPILLQILTTKKTSQHLLIGATTLLLFVQLFWTIDPAIIYTSESIDSGKKPIYKLALPGDVRIGMALGSDFGRGYEVYGDLYAYNLEHNFYDSLLDEAMTEIKPESDTQLILLDVIYYETHLTGNRYPIYWNTRTEKRTYDGSDPDSIFLTNNPFVTTDQISSGDYDLDPNFYLIVPGRIDSTEARTAIESFGYTLTTELHPENMYGSMSVFGYQLDES